MFHKLVRISVTLFVFQNKIKAAKRILDNDFGGLF